MVRDKVLETLRLTASELKSDVSTNSTNPAYLIKSLYSSNLRQIGTVYEDLGGIHEYQLRLTQPNAREA